MFGRKLWQRNKISYLRPNYVLKRDLKEAKACKINYETHLERLPTKQPTRQSFLKALISGKIDEDVFSYPEQTSNRYKGFIKWLQPIEDYLSCCSGTREETLNKQEVLNNLRELEVFRTHIDETNFGLELSKAESSRLVEVLTTVPWLGSYFMKNHILPIQLISKYGTQEQKKMYFTKIMSGEIIPTLCIGDTETSTNINDITTYVVSDEDGWLLNGKKAFVPNGIDSNLYLVFARHGSHWCKEKPDSFSLLLVEKHFPGVSCKEVYESVTRQHIPTCTMAFDDTVIPSKNIIGEAGGALEIMLECLKPGQQNISAQAISILRSFSSLLISDVLKLKHFDRNLHEFDIVKKIIGEITFALYTMESMAYLTHGMIDKYENIDAEIEQVITDTYCANKCLSCIQAGMQLLGATSYINKHLYVQALHNALALTTIDSSNIDANVYIAMRVFQFLGQDAQDHVYKKRNFLKHPLYNMLDNIINKSEIKLAAEKYLHPSVQHGANDLEDALNKFKKSMMSLFVKHGSQVGEKYSDLHRVTEMIMHIFAAYANLLRSSRAYAIGVRNADIEKYIGVSTAYMADKKISALVQDIEDGPFFTGEHCYSVTMDLMYEKRKYPMEHPLTRTY